MTELSEHIRSIDLVGLVESHGVELRRSGFRMIGLCPLHLDSSPSFFIFPDKNRFKCFGCQKSGDPADFVMEIHQVGFSEALGILGIRSSGQSSPEVHKNIKNRQRRRDLKKAFDEWVRIAADEVATLVRCAHKVALQIKDSETLEKYGEVFHMIPSWEYHLDILLSGSGSEKLELFKVGYYGN